MMYRLRSPMTSMNNGTGTNKACISLSDDSSLFLWERGGGGREYQRKPHIKSVLA